MADFDVCGLKSMCGCSCVMMRGHGGAHQCSAEHSWPNRPKADLPAPGPEPCGDHAPAGTEGNLTCGLQRGHSGLVHVASDGTFWARQPACGARCPGSHDLICGEAIGHIGNHHSYDDEAGPGGGTWWEKEDGPTPRSGLKCGVRSKGPAHRICDLPAGHDGNHQNGIEWSWPRDESLPRQAEVEGNEPGEVPLQPSGRPCGARHPLAGLEVITCELEHGHSGDHQSLRSLPCDGRKAMWPNTGSPPCGRPCDARFSARPGYEVSCALGSGHTGDHQSLTGTTWPNVRQVVGPAVPAVPLVIWTGLSENGDPAARIVLLRDGYSDAGMLVFEFTERCDATGQPVWQESWRGRAVPFTTEHDPVRFLVRSLALASPVTPNDAKLLCCRWGR